MLENAVVCGADFRQPNRCRNHCLHNGQVLAIGVFDGRHNILTEVRLVCHGHKHTADFQLGIDLPLDALHSIDQLRHVFGSKILCLNRNQNIIRCRQSIDDQHTEGRAAIQQDIIVVLFNLIRILPQHRLPAHDIHQSHLNGGQCAVARDEIKALVMVADFGMLTAADTRHDVVHGISQCQRQIIRLSQSQHFG